jgi:hypothetical protein
MSDLVNALSTQSRSSGVLDAIAHPNVVNPLADFGGAVNVARGVQDLRTQQFNLQQAQLQPAYQAMRQVMATNPDPSWDDVNNALAQSARIGGNIDGLVANANETMARGGKPGDFIRAYGLGGMTPWEQGQLAGPQRMSQQTAAGTYYGTTPGLWASGAGTFQPAGFVAKGLSPTEQMQPYTVMGPDGTPITVPAGAAYGGGGAPGSGGGGPAGGGGGGPVVQPQGPPPGATVQPGQPLSQKDADLARFAQRESGNQNIFSKVQVPGYTQEQTGSGYYQIIPSTWAEGQALAGIPPAQRTQLAIQATPQQQYQVASALYDKYGGRPWARSAPGGAAGGGGGGGGGGGPTQGPFIGATSAQPVAGSGGNVQPAGGSGMQYLPASPGGGGGGVLAGGYSLPSPGLQPELDAGAKQHAADIGNLATLPTRIQPLMSALNVLKANPDLTTGAGQDQWNTWMGALKGMGLPLPDWAAADKTPAWQELGKYLMQNTRAMPGANQSDMSRLQAEVSSPHIDQQRDAIMELSARQIGLERFQLAGLKYFDSQFSDPTAAASHSGTYRLTTAPWLAKLDPTAFAADLMEPKATQRYYQSLTSAQQARYRESLVAAKQLFGIQLPIPQGGNGGG